MNEEFRICKACAELKPIEDFKIRVDNNRRIWKCSKCKRQEHLDYCAKNRESQRLKSIKYRKENPEKCREQCRKYRIANYDKVRKQDNLRKKERGRTDLNFRIRVKCKSLLRNGLKSQGLKKNNLSCLKFISCSIDEFKKHIENQFELWMNWDNYGKKWHIGHILPCELFELTNEREIAICFHFSNLKPQEAKENIRLQDSLLNGRRARDLTREEKIEYLNSIGVYI